MRIDSSGRLLVGTVSSTTVYGTHHQLQVEGTSAATASASIIRNSADVNPPLLSLGKSRGTSDGSSTVVQSGDYLGSIVFAGADGTDKTSIAGRLDCLVDGTPGSDDMPGRLTFSTTADGAATPTERMRIDSSGRLLLGTTTEGHVSADDLTIASTGQAGITIRSGTGDNGSIYFSDGTSGADEYRGTVEYKHDTNSLRLHSNATLALTLDSSQNATFAGTVSDSKGELRTIPLNINSTGYTLVAADAGKAVTNTSGGWTVNNSIFSAGQAVTLINNGSGDQTITQGSGVTIYNTADAATGNRTLASRGMATLIFYNASTAYISGAGLS